MKQQGALCVSGNYDFTKLKFDDIHDSDMNIVKYCIDMTVPRAAFREAIHNQATFRC